MSNKVTSNNKLKLWIIVGAVMGVILVLGILSFVFRPGDISQTQNITSGTNDKEKSDEQVARALTPCNFLTESERATFQLDEGEADNKNIRGCKWRSPPNDDANKILYVSAMIYPLYGLDKMPRSDENIVQPLTIGSHNAQRLTTGEGSLFIGLCTIDIAIGPKKSASVRLGANYGSSPNTDKACSTLMRVAALIEPKLP